VRVRNRSCKNVKVDVNVWCHESTSDGAGEIVKERAECGCSCYVCIHFVFEGRESEARALKGFHAELEVA